MDRRDSPSWVIMELSPQGEDRLLEGTLESALRTDLKVGPEFPLFLPAYTHFKGARRVTLLLMEGYAFIGGGLSDVQYFRLEHKSYCTRILTRMHGRSRVIQSVSDSHVKDLQRQLREMIARDVPEGVPVTICEGAYRGLRGLVIEGDAAVCLVQVRMRSFEMLLTLPRVAVLPLDEEVAL